MILPSEDVFKASGKSISFCNSDCGRSFFHRYRAAKFLVSIWTGSPDGACRTILVHDIEPGMRGDVFSNELDDSLCLLTPSGEEEMADKKSAGCDPICKCKITDLMMHLAQGRLAEIWVMGGACKDLCSLFVSIFEIRHVDVNDAIKKPKGAGILISSRIVHNGDMKAGICGDKQRAEDCRELVRWGDEVNIMAPLCLQMEKYVREIVLSQLIPLSFMADLIVLTEYASHGASGKEDGS